MFFTSCIVAKKAPPHKPYLVKNTINIHGGLFSKLERTDLNARMADQLDDSSKLTIRESIFFFRNVIRPPRYDSVFSATSAKNMQASMFHLGYYHSTVNFKADTTGRRVKVNYHINTGNPTIISSFQYQLEDSAIQKIVTRSSSKSLLKEGAPVTKVGVTTEMGRLVDTLRNNGYYKFSAADFRMRGDTTFTPLIAINRDPLDQWEQLATALQKRDSPEIRLTLVLNPPADSTHFQAYTIDSIIIIPDFFPGDQINAPTLQHIQSSGIHIRYHQLLFKPALLSKLVALRPGLVFSQSLYFKSITNFSKTGLWESVNARIIEDSTRPNKVTIIFELLPSSKYAFEAALEASYSANSNTNNALAGNLFGLSGNLSLTDRNLAKEGIRMTHTLRAGIELNNRHREVNSSLVNATEISYGNMLVFPRLITPIKSLNRKTFPVTESFISSNIAYSNRLYLFNTRAFNMNYGINIQNKKGWKWTFKPINVEFNDLYNQTDSFRRILDSIPFLRYSYNTALILGMGAGVSHTYFNPKHPHSLSKERTIAFNIEESGLTWGALLPALKKYRRQYIRTDIEYKHTTTYKSTELAFRLFTGIGIAVGRDTTLPFFKQYFSGGNNGMRAWPVRGIGRGSQRLAPFGQNIFNDRTGDLQLEGNVEYRYVIARIIPNTLTLRGALFVDVGNIWNLRNAHGVNTIDSAQFKFKNLYKELGVAAGTGFRLDFNYFVLRLDLGFRIKRPELSYINNGWKLPNIGFNDLLPKLFGRKSEYRQWRYENFNFTIGISYPF